MREVNDMIIYAAGPLGVISITQKHMEKSKNWAAHRLVAYSRSAAVKMLNDHQAIASREIKQYM